MKVYFREHNNTLAEELYAHLEFKVGIMLEMITLYTINKSIENNPITNRYHGSDAPLYDMKIYEIQNLVFTHFISTIESTLRKFVLAQGFGHEKIILNQILEFLHKKHYITQEHLHLWNGLRQMRNAVVHYDSKAHTTDSYHYSRELDVSLKEGQVMESTDLYSQLKLMEWMAFNVKEIIS